MLPADLIALVNEYANLSYHGMRAGPYRMEVDVQLELDSRAGEVVRNPEEMSRVVVNLCNNAFDAIGQKTERRGIKIESGLHDTGTLFSVILNS